MRAPSSKYYFTAVSGSQHHSCVYVCMWRPCRVRHVDEEGATIPLLIIIIIIIIIFISDSFFCSECIITQTPQHSSSSLYTVYVRTPHASIHAVTAVVLVAAAVKHAFHCINNFYPLSEVTQEERDMYQCTREYSYSSFGAYNTCI